MRITASMSIRRRFNTVMLVLGVLTSFVFASCSETVDDTILDKDKWKTDNIAYFNKVYAEAKAKADAGDKSWKVLKSFSKNEATVGIPTDYVVVEVLNVGEGTESPIYTDSVRMHYRGTYYPGLNYTGNSNHGKSFDSSWTGAYNLPSMIPSSFAVRNLVDGCSTALQHMHVGDRWRIYIPYQLGYGEKSKDIIACSTLIFDVTLQTIGHPGKPMPPFK